jgi:hypothetical protein
MKYKGKFVLPLLIALACPAVGLGASQSITFNSIPDQLFGVSPFPLIARASSGLPVSFSSTTPGTCKVTGSLVLLLGPGPCSITANQAGNGSFDAATVVTRSFTISTAKPSGALIAAAGGSFALNLPTVAVADFDGDGNPDIAVQAGGLSPYLHIYLGDGSGGFLETATPIALDSPGLMTSGDFNGDGVADLAIVGQRFLVVNVPLTILPGNGHGGFTPGLGSPFPLPRFFQGYPIAGDFDGNGKQDVLIAGSNHLDVLLQNSAGFTDVPITSADAAEPNAGAVGDFNDDGILDVATANYNKNNVTVLLGSADGQFASGIATTLTAGSQSRSIVVGDFNNDGYEDLATACTEGVWVWFGDGAGNFSPSTHNPFTVSNPQSLAVGDFDGDGHQDLAVADLAGEVLILLGTGSGDFNASLAFTGTSSPFSTRAVDFNNDGIQDLLVSTDTAVSALLGHLAPTTSTISVTSPSPVTVGQSVSLSIAVADGSGGFANPTGSVTIKDGATTLGEATGNSTPFAFTASGLTIGSHSLSAVYVPDVHHTGSTSPILNIQVDGVAQTISFNPLNNAALNSGNVSLAATASSSLGVSFTSTTPAVCTVSGNTVTLVSVGTCSIDANQAGDATYAAAPTVTRSFTVANATQTISFSALNPGSATSFALVASATSNLPVTFVSNTTNVCTVSESTVTMLSFGVCSITASQAGDGNYAPATPVTQTYARSNGTSLQCNAPVANALFVRGEGTNELVADVTLNCAASSAATLNVQAFLAPAVTISSAVVGADGNAVSETVAGITDGTVYTSSPVHGIVSANGVTFNNIAIPAGGAIVRIANIRMNASQVSTGSGAPVAVAETIFIGGTNVTPSVLSSINVAFVTNGLAGIEATAPSSNPVCSATTAAAPNFNVHFREGFATAFRVQTASGNSVPGFWASGGTETGYYVAVDSASNTATSGTRVKVTFHNIPANVALYVPRTIASNGGTMTLTASESGAFSPLPASTAPGAPNDSASLAIVGGTAIAVYEETADVPAEIESYEVPVYLVAAADTVTPAANPITATVSFAPIGAGSNIPNFVGGVSDATVTGSTFISCSDGTPQTITFGALSNTPLSTGSVPLVATASSGLRVDFASTTPAVCQASGNAATLLSTGACSIEATQAGDGTFAPAVPFTRTFTVTATNAQTIVFGPLSNVAVETPPFTIGATATSGLPVTFTSTTPSICTVNESTVTIFGAGTCTITASQPGDGTYAAAVPVSQSFLVVVNASQASCTPSSNSVFVRGEGTAELVGDLVLSCTGGNALPMDIRVSLSPAVAITSRTVDGQSEIVAGLNATSTSFAPGVVHGVISNNNVTFTGVPTASGSYTITITNIRVNAASLSLSGVPIAISGTVLISGAATTPAYLDPVNVAYATNGLSVSQSASAPSYPVCHDITATTPVFNVQFGEAYSSAFKIQGSAESNSSLGSAFTSSTETGFGLISGPATNTASSGTRIKIVFANVPSGVTLYVPTTITNNGATMTLTESESGPFSAVTASTAGDAPAGAAVRIISNGTATAIYEETAADSAAVESYSVPVYLAGTVQLQDSAMTATVSFAPIGDDASLPNFLNGASTTTVNVAQFVDCGKKAATQVITFAQPADTTSSSATLIATASSGLAVTFASNSPETCTVSGNVATLTGSGSCSITASQPGDDDYAAAVPVTRSFIVGASNTQTISFPDIPTMAVGWSTSPGARASSGLPVSLASNSPSICTVTDNTVQLVAPGTCSITASQAGNENYLPAAPVTQTFQVVNSSGTTACSTATANPVFVRVEGTKELVADINVNCSTGSGLPANLTLYLSPAVQITSAKVGAGAASEALAGLVNSSHEFVGNPVSGVVSGNSVTFTNVPTAAGGPFTFVITNIRVDASWVQISNGTPVGITAAVFVSGASVTAAVVQVGPVAFAVNGLSSVTVSDLASIPVCSAVTAASPGFSVHFAEGFAPAFRTAGSYSSNATLGSSFVNNTETGFGFTSGAGSNNANSGTRVKIVFNNVPANLAMYVPLTISSNGGEMTLVTSEAGPYSSASQSFAAGAPANSSALTVSGGSTTAIYEETTNAPSAIEQYTVPVYLVAGASTVPAQSSITATVSFAPNGASANLPNFVSGSSTTTVTGSALTGCTSTITFTPPTDTVFGAGNVTLSATSSADLPVTFASTTPSVCSVSENSVSLLSGGSCSITASQAASPYYAAATDVVRSFNIAPAAQTITFGPLDNRPLNSAPLTLSAGTSSGLPVTFISNTATICSVSDSKVTPLAVGTCSITASQSGSASYAAAASVTQLFSITNVLFQDSFATPASKLDLAKWNTVTGAPSFLGRTQLADWISSGSSWTFTIGEDGAHLTLNTFNPTGSSLYGTQGQTIAWFQPSGNAVLEYTTRLQLTSIQPGVVYGTYLYGCAPAACATQHDEIDIELVTNSLQNAPLQVELNRYAAEPLGAGHGTLVNLPDGFDPLAPHSWTIRWSLNEVDYLVDGTLLLSATDHVPQGPMQADVIAWGPDNSWEQAYSASLATAADAGQNTAYTALLTSASVSQTQGGSLLQAITFPAPSSVDFGSGPVSPEATATSGLPVTFTSTTQSVCSVSDGSLALTATGTCTVTASQAGNGNYAPAPSVTQSFTVMPGANVITFNGPGAQTIGISPPALSATASSGLSVTFVSESEGICTVSGTTLTLVTAGTCSITASQPGNGNYAAATPVTRSFVVNPATSGGGGGNGGGGAPGGGSPLTIAPSSVNISAIAGGAPGTAQIILTYQTFTQTVPTFSANFNTNQGQGWLSVSPASGGMALSSTSGLQFHYTATLIVSGDPAKLTGGTYTGTVNVSAAGSIVSVPVTLNVSTVLAKYTVTPSSLTFNYQIGTQPAPAAQTISVFSAPVGAGFGASAVSSGGGGNWLSVSTLNAVSATPGVISVAVAVNGFTQAGQYSGQVAVKTGTSTVNVPVTLNIIPAQPPAISISPAQETFSIVQGGAASSGQVTVTNTGGETLSFSTSATSDGWLKINGPGSGSATPSSPATVGFTIDPKGLTPGVYNGRIIADGGSGLAANSTIVLTVTSAKPQIRLSRTGITLSGVAGGGATATEIVNVSNNGGGSLHWTESASTLSGGSWLVVSPASGTAAAGSAGSAVSISANPAKLAAGTYSGSVNFTAADAVNSPQTISVTLTVAAGQPFPAVSVSAGGAILSGTAGSATPATATLSLYNLASGAISYSATSSASWLSVNPSSGSLSPGRNQVQITADLSDVSALLQSGTLSLGFGDGSGATISVVLLALPPGTSGASRPGLRPMASVAACSGGKASFLIPVFQQPFSGAGLKVSSATDVKIQVVDDCGKPVTAAAGASVQVSFSNGDPAINLVDTGAGVWEATWTPATAASQVTLQVAASENGLTLKSTAGVATSETVSVAAASAGAAPQPTGIANAASAGQAIPQVVAPGSYVAIYGTNLAGNGNPSATAGQPLPATLNGAHLTLGGLPLPLLYASPTQVNAVIPQDIAPNATYPLVVVNGTAQSVPVALTVTELQPGVYTVDTSGSGAGIVADAVTGKLITASNPARAGENLVIYMTGLGALTGTNGEQQPADGAIAPSTTIYRTQSNVSVTIGGVPVEATQFAGLTPTLTALYQVNVQMPEGVGPGGSVPVVVTATSPATGGTAVSNTVTIAVQ